MFLLKLRVSFVTPKKRRRENGKTQLKIEIEIRKKRSKEQNTDILQPLLTNTNIPTYIADTNQLLHRLHKLPTLPPQTTLISSDVTALYPSIPHDSGLLAVTSFLERCTSYNSDQVVAIVNALYFVIRYNYVMWNGDIFKQKTGVAMGTPVAVAYANIFMSEIDRKIKTQADFLIEHIRFIDDNLFIVPSDRVDDLFLIVNNVHKPQIKYTFEFLTPEKDLPFLDTQLSIRVCVGG